MRILITGAKGMLGKDLAGKLAQHTLLLTDIEEMDISKREQVHAVFSQFKPELVIHSAAFADVDDCEFDADLARLVNETGSANVALACQASGSRLIAISTDYVFDGQADQAYTEDHLPDPQTQYGISKLAAENAIKAHCDNYLILRTAWLYGPGGPSFVHTMRKLMAVKGEPLKVVNDQFGNPTSTTALSNLIVDLLGSDFIGVAHATCDGDATWFDFAVEIKKLIGAGRGIIPCTTEEFPRPAPRPKNSRLENRVISELGITPMPSWQKALKDFIESEYDEDNGN